MRGLEREHLHLTIHVHTCRDFEHASTFEAESVLDRPIKLRDRARSPDTSHE